MAESAEATALAAAESAADAAVERRTLDGLAAAVELGEAVLRWLCGCDLGRIMCCAASWRTAAGAPRLWRALASRHPLLGEMRFEGAVDWRHLVEHGSPRTPDAASSAHLRVERGAIRPAPAFLLVLEAKPMRRPNTRRTVRVAGAADVDVNVLFEAFAAVVGAEAIASVEPPLVEFHSDAAADAATAVHGILLRGGRRLTARLAAGDEWRRISARRCGFEASAGGGPGYGWTAVSGARDDGPGYYQVAQREPLDDAFAAADALGARLLRVTVVAYSPRGAFAPTVVLLQDLPRGAFDRGSVPPIYWREARYNGLGHGDPVLSADRGFYWGAPASAWGRLRVTRPRRAADPRCDHCVTQGPDLRRCCGETRYCDASCARDAWLFTHARACARGTPLGSDAA